MKSWAKNSEKGTSTNITGTKTRRKNSAIEKLFRAGKPARPTNKEPRGKKSKKGPPIKSSRDVTKPSRGRVAGQRGRENARSGGRQRSWV